MKKKYKDPRREKLLDFRHRGWFDFQTPWVRGGIRVAIRTQEHMAKMLLDDPPVRRIKVVGQANGPMGRKTLYGF